VIEFLQELKIKSQVKIPDLSWLLQESVNILNSTILQLKNAKALEELQCKY
jgi:hypothetical protein